MVPDSSEESVPVTGELNTLAAAIDGHHVYVGSKRGYLHVLDVSDPRTPVWVGSYKTTGRANGVAVVGGLVYVNEGEGGLTILRFQVRETQPKSR
jgi:hypothetical protein